MSITDDRFQATTSEETGGTSDWPDGSMWATNSGFHSGPAGTGINNGLRLAAVKYNEENDQPVAATDLNPVALIDRRCGAGFGWIGLTITDADGTSLTKSDTFDWAAGGWVRRVLGQQGGGVVKYYHIDEVDGDTATLSASLGTTYEDDAYSYACPAPSSAILSVEGWYAGSNQPGGMAGIIATVKTEAGQLVYQQWDPQQQEVVELTDVNGGAAVAVHGRVLKSGAPSVWGMWAHATRKSATGADSGHAYGIEVNVQNEKSDNGAQDSINVANAADIGIRILNQGGSSDYPITAGLSIGGSASNKRMWNGVLFDAESIRSDGGGVAVNMVSATPYIGIKFGEATYSHLYGTDGLWSVNTSDTDDIISVNNNGRKWQWRKGAAGTEIMELANNGGLSILDGSSNTLFDVAGGSIGSGGGTVTLRNVLTAPASTNVVIDAPSAQQVLLRVAEANIAAVSAAGLDVTGRVTSTTTIQAVGSLKAGAGDGAFVADGSTGSFGAWSTTPPGSQPAHIADADTSHSLGSTYDAGAVNSALDALGTKINSLISLAEAYGLAASS